MICREYGAPWVSIHIRHGPTARPRPSTGTVLAHCPVTQTATTRDGSTAPVARPRAAASRTSSHQWAASWVAASPSRWVDTGAWSCQATEPASETRPTFSALVPRSTASTNWADGGPERGSATQESDSSSSPSERVSSRLAR